MREPCRKYIVNYDYSFRDVDSLDNLPMRENARCFVEVKNVHASTLGALQRCVSGSRAEQDNLARLFYMNEQQKVAI